MTNKELFKSLIAIMLFIALVITLPSLAVYTISVQYTKDACGVRLSYDECQQLYQSGELELTEYVGINFVDGDDNSIVVVCADSFVDYIRWKFFERAQIKEMRESTATIKTKQNEDHVNTLLEQNAF